MNFDRRAVSAPTLQLAQWVSSLRYADLPARTREVVAGLQHELIANLAVGVDIDVGGLFELHITFVIDFVAWSDRVGMGHAKFLALGRFQVFFQKWVIVEHLVDFLAQLQCRELQQANRLLQLGRQGQML